jgi:uncharacterized membrane protein
MPEMAAENKTLVASLAGALVTVLTAMQQFRRPEERWHHYRKLTERMQAEYWAFVNMDEEIYKGVLYDEQKKPKSRKDKAVRSAAFQVFHERMTRLRKRTCRSSSTRSRR